MMDLQFHDENGALIPATICLVPDFENRHMYKII